MTAVTNVIDCKDLIEFQRLLNKLRVAEDKILFNLNCELPTSSFADKKKTKLVCNEIEKKLSDIRSQRSQLIYKCAKENQMAVSNFRNKESKFGELRAAHHNLRLLKNEYSVEEIIIKQTDRILHDRCRKEMF